MDDRTNASASLAGPRPAAALLLLAAVAVAFGAALSGGFVYDDLALVAGNPRLADARALFSSLGAPHWGFEDPTAAAEIGFWRPLTLVALALGKALGGGQPFGLHVLSLALHALATLACWRFATELLSSERSGLVAAVLFAVHPVHVESVAWISAVNDPLASIFVFASLRAFLVWRRCGSRGLPIRAALWWIPGLLAKEQALAVLPMAAALDFALYVRQADSDEGELLPLARAYAPLLVALMGYWLARALVFGDLLAGFDRPGAHFGFDVGRAMQFRIELFGGFLGLLAWPVHLLVFRPVRPELPPLDPAFYAALGWVAAWALLVVLSWRRRARRALAALLFVPAALAPVLLSFESAGAFPLSDRYLYVAVAGAGMLVALAVQHLPRAATLPVVVALAGLCTARSIGHVTTWRDDETFFRAAVEGSPRSPYVHWGLGRVLLSEYRTSGEREMLDEALYHYLVSLSLGDDYGEYAPKLGPDAPLEDRLAEMLQVVNDSPPEARRPDPTVMVSLDDRLQANIGQGWCYLFLAETTPEQDFDRPLLVFEQTVKSFPRSYHAWTGLGTTHMQRGEYAQAREAFGRALEINPTHAEAWHNLGQTLLREGDWDGARRAFEAALERRPEHLPDLIGVATSAIEGGREELAREALERAHRVAPESVDPPFWRGMLEARRRAFPAALDAFDTALARQPDYGRAHLERGKVLRQLGDPTEAMRALGRACELLPTSFEAHYTLGALLLEAGSSESALPYLVRAYELAPRDGAEQILEPLHAKLAELLGDDVPRLLSLTRIAESRADWVHALDWVDRVLARLEGTPADDEQRARLADAYHRRGRYLQQLERPEEAVVAYRRSLELVPDRFWALHDLGLLLGSGLGREAEAEPLLARALEQLPDVRLGDETFRPAVRRNLEAALAFARGEAGPAPPAVEATELAPH